MERFQLPEYFSGLTTVHSLNSALMVTFGVSISYGLATISFHGLEQPFLPLTTRFNSPATAGATSGTASGTGAIL